MIAANDEDADISRVQLADLVGQEARRLHRGLVAVVQIARQQQGVHPLLQAQLDDARERLPCRIADQFRQFPVPQRQRPQRRIQMDVGGVDEPEWHGQPPSVVT